MSKNEKSNLEKTLPADKSLTEDAFKINDNGTVTINDTAIADLLKRELPKSVGDLDREAVKVSVGVDI